MRRILLPLAFLALLATLSCEKIIGRPPLVPGDGPLEGNTEVSIYVPDCGDHRDVKKVIFDTQPQVIVSQKEDEVKIRTQAVTEEVVVPVKLILTNNRTCETGATFRYVKMEQSTINYVGDQAHPMGERRIGGWRPDQPNAPAPTQEEQTEESATEP